MNSIIIKKFPMSFAYLPIFICILIWFIFGSVGFGIIIACLVAIEAIAKIYTTELEINGIKKEAYFSSYLSKKAVKEIISIEYSGIPFYNSITIKSKGSDELCLRFIQNSFELQQFIKTWNSRI